MKPGNILVLIYNSFNDPLVQNLMLDYIKTVSPEVKKKFVLVTFEQEKYALAKAQSEEISIQLRTFNIIWRPLTFHTGRLLLLKKLWDLSRALVLITVLRLRYATHTLLCFANVAGSMGYIISGLLRMKLIVYSYEPHSDFMADLGIWRRNSLKYKLLNSIEWKVGEQADVILTGTQHMVDELKRRKSRARVYRAPTGVDPEVFRFSSDDRQKTRASWGVEGDQPVFLYVGKFGDLYYTHEIGELFEGIKKQLPPAYFVIVTSNDHSEIRKMLADYLKAEDFFVTGWLPYSELRAYLSGADMGISGVPPSPNQKYRSPTKVAEYLMHGLPYITTDGVSEDDHYARCKNVGVSVSKFELVTDNRFYDDINILLREDKMDQRMRIRAVGLEYRSKKRIETIFIDELK